MVRAFLQCIYELFFDNTAYINTRRIALDVISDTEFFSVNKVHYGPDNACEAIVQHRIHSV